MNTQLRREETNKSPLWVFLAFLVPFLGMWIAFAFCRVHPFGDMQMLYSDLREQYYPFFQEFHARLRSGESLLWAWNGGFGTDFWALIAYYIASPLNLVSIFFAQESLRDLLTLFLTIKIGCAGGFFAIMLRKIFHRNDFSVTLFSWMFALCSFILGYYWDVIWMDTVALLPLVFLGLYLLITEGKFRLYVISLALAVLSNYYIGAFVCYFCVIAFFAVAAIRGVFGRRFLARFGQFALSSLLAGGLTMFLLLHAAKALTYTDSASGTAALEPKFYYSYTQVIGNLLAFRHPTAMEGLPNLYCTVLPLLLLVVYLRSKKIGTEEKIITSGFLIFFIFSTNFNLFDYILHGFHFPNMLPARYSFLICFVLILIGYRAFLLLKNLSRWDVVGMTVLAAAMIGLSLFEAGTIKTMGNIILLAAYLLFFFLYERRLLGAKALSVFLALTVTVELSASLVLSMDTVGKSSYTNYPYREKEISGINRTLETLDDGFWRTEMSCRYYLNDGMFYRYRGVGQFSSTANRNVRDLMSGLGFTTGANSYYYNFSTPLNNALLGLKYIFSRSGDLVEGSQVTKQFEREDLTVYQNDAFLGMGFMTDWKLMEFAFTNSPFQGQNTLFQTLTGVDDRIFIGREEDSYEARNFASLTKTGSGTYQYTTDDRTGNLDITFTAPSTGTYYAYMKIGGGGDINVMTSEQQIYNHPVAKLRYIAPICRANAGDTITVSVMADANQEDKTISFYFYYFDEDTFKQGWEQLQDETWDPKMISETHLKGTVAVKQAGLLCTLIPYTEGWKLYVDGKPQPVVPLISDALIGADLSEGTHTIDLIYEPEGFRTGCVISAVSLVALIVLSLLFKNGFPVPTGEVKRKKKDEYLPLPDAQVPESEEDNDEEDNNDEDDSFFDDFSET